MLEDRFLRHRFNSGDRDVLPRVYDKYKDGLVTLAMALSNDRSAAEDAVHEVFLHLSATCGSSRITKNLKGYLATCVANSARDMNSARRKKRESVTIEDCIIVDPALPDDCAAQAEQLHLLNSCLNELPYDQREVICLHVFGGMRFRAIANMQGASINTVQGRYRYD